MSVYLYPINLPIELDPPKNNYPSWGLTSKSVDLVWEYLNESIIPNYLDLDQLGNPLYVTKHRWVTGNTTHQIYLVRSFLNRNGQLSRTFGVTRQLDADNPGEELEVIKSSQTVLTKSLEEIVKRNKRHGKDTIIAIDSQTLSRPLENKFREFFGSNLEIYS